MQHEDGPLERLKAQLFGNGMRQVEGINYTEMFRPVLHPLSIQLILTLPVIHEWRLMQGVLSDSYQAFGCLAVEKECGQSGDSRRTTTISCL